MNKQLQALTIFSSIFIFSCCFPKSLTIDDAVRTIGDAQFVQEYMKFRSDMNEARTDIIRMKKEGKLSEENFNLLQRNYNHTKTEVDNVFEDLVEDLVLNIDQIAADSASYVKKYTDEFQTAINSAKKRDQFYYNYQQFSNTDVAVPETVVIIGKLVFEGVKYLLKHNENFKKMTIQKLSSPVKKKFGLPSFES